LLIILKFLLLFLFFYSKPIAASDECIGEKNIKIGIMNNDYIDYRYYLYYELGNYAQENSINFEINIVDKNIDDFDIIFGEYNELKKNFSTTQILLPDKIKKFYEDNGLDIKNNILPLDLDTLIILSNQSYSLKNLEELSNVYSPIKYTFAMSFNNNDELPKLIQLSSHQDNLKLESHTIESTLSLFNKIYNNSNKNILDANYDELYNSFESKENLFTLFSDGVMLYKNLENSYFNLFPQNKFIWNEKLGVFSEISNSIPYSYYGFSAYINNTNQIGLICHFTKDEVRKNTFKNFNLQISPISMSELRNLENLPIGYEKIIELKNKYIIEINQNLSSQINLVRDIIYEKQNYRDLIKSDIYLNY
jgi:hypothetical protein